MKNVFYSILLFAGICCAFFACSKGAYNADTSSGVNNIVSPLTPLDSAGFTWLNTGSSPMSADINGVHWVAGYGTWALDTVGGNKIYGVLGGKVMYLYLNQVYQGNIYPMAFHDSLQSAIWSDSLNGGYNSYYSKYGNSGEVQILVNNATTIEGLFYFKGITTEGQVVAVTNGYFKLPK